MPTTSQRIRRDRHQQHQGDGDRQEEDDYDVPLLGMGDGLRQPAEQGYLFLTLFYDLITEAKHIVTHPTDILRLPVHAMKEAHHVP